MIRIKQVKMYQAVNVGTSNLATHLKSEPGKLNLTIDEAVLREHCICVNDPKLDYCTFIPLTNIPGINVDKADLEGMVEKPDKSKKGA